MCLKGKRLKKKKERTCADASGSSLELSGAEEEVGGARAAAETSASCSAAASSPSMKETMVGKQRDCVRGYGLGLGSGV